MPQLSFYTTAASISVTPTWTGGHTPTWTTVDGVTGAVTTYDTANLSHTFSGATTSAAPHRFSVANGSKTFLSVLDVSSKSLVGSIPSLAGLTALQVFRCYANQLTGSIPSLAGLTALQVLYCYGNQLTGSIPSLAGLTALQVFHCSNNQLTGSIPSLTGLTALQQLYCYSNQLTGSTDVNAPAMRDFRWQDNAWTQANVDACLQQMYSYRASYTYATPVANLGGTNASPSGVYADEDPPTTGEGYRYELVNDPEAEGFNKWTITV